jgi:hypothetical protein
MVMSEVTSQTGHDADSGRKWHFSEVVVPMRDVRSWGKTGSGQRWGEPTRLTTEPTWSNPRT